MDAFLAQAEESGTTFSDVVVRVLAVIGAIVGLLTAALAYSNSRRGRSYRTTSGSTIATVVQVIAPEPAKWQKKRFPEGWEDDESVRRSYWRRQRIGGLATTVVAGLTTFLGFLGYLTDYWDMGILWLFYSVLAIPYYVYGMRRLSRLPSEPWKEATLSGKKATLIVAGRRENVLSRCLAALRAIGGVIVKFDADQGSVIAATGRDAWWFTPQKVKLTLAELDDDGRFEVTVISDDPYPAPEGVLKPNLANVRRFVAELSSSEPDTASALPLQDQELVVNVNDSSETGAA